MKKVAVDREEGIAEVIDRMLEIEDNEVTLVVPRGSVLARSVSNFHLLKREADAAGKSIAIESVDDTILAFAKESEQECGPSRPPRDHSRPGTGLCGARPKRLRPHVH